LFVGLVSGHDLLDELVDAARVLQLDLGATPVEVLQFAEHCHVAVQPDVQAFQLVVQLLTYICTTNNKHTQYTAVKTGCINIGF